TAEPTRLMYMYMWQTRADAVSGFDRREFLRIVAAAAVARSRFAHAAPSPISVWSTFGNNRHAKLPSLAWGKAGASPTNVIAIDPAQELQDILGFGGAFTDAACYVLSRLDAGVRKQLFHR